MILFKENFTYKIENCVPRYEGYIMGVRVRLCIRWMVDFFNLNEENLPDNIKLKCTSRETKNTCVRIKKRIVDGEERALVNGNKLKWFGWSEGMALALLEKYNLKKLYIAKEN